MPRSRIYADQVCQSLAKTTLDVLRRELTSLLLQPEAELTADHLGAARVLFVSAKVAAGAGRESHKQTWALRDLGDQAQSDIAQIEHALQVLTAIHAPQPTAAP